MMTKRKDDINGWFEIKGNPISKVGIFEYSSEQVNGPEMGKIYRVYRPASELSKPETLESFKLLPLINDHTMLGGEDEGLTPAEEKGVDGVIGEEVYFEEPFIRANIKVFSEKLRKAIESGKVDLSCGYRCEYDFTPGEFDGQPYDAVQINIRGNHLALVDEGRMGKEVVVLDHLTFTIDKKDIQTMEKEEMLAKLAAAAKVLEDGNGLSADDIAGLESVVDSFKSTDEEPSDTEKQSGDSDEEPKAADEGEEVKASSDDDDDEPVAGDEEKATDDDEGTIEDKVVAAVVNEVIGDDDKKAAASMDAALRKALKGLHFSKKASPSAMDTKAIVSEIAVRDKLANRLSEVIGTFDHSGMTAQNVAEYGAKKLGLKAKGKAAIIALDAYLVGAKRAAGKTAVAQDTRNAPSSFIANYLKGSK